MIKAECRKCDWSKELKMAPIPVLFGDGSMCFEYPEIFCPKCNRLAICSESKEDEKRLKKGVTTLIDAAFPPKKK